MRAYNVAPQEGQAMKIVSGTLIVVLTLIGLIVAVPVILFGFAAIFDTTNTKYRSYEIIGGEQEIQEG